jgi:hypothetical protein
MSTWCFNKLTVVDGPEQEKLRFLEFVRKLDFNELIPEPSEEQIKDDYNHLPPIFPPLINWRIVNWNTKWNVNPDDINEVDGGVTFLTAWAPPFWSAPRKLDHAN